MTFNESYHPSFHAIILEVQHPKTPSLLTFPPSSCSMLHHPSPTSSVLLQSFVAQEVSAMFVTSSGLYSSIFFSKRASIAFSTASSLSLLTNETAIPLVPKRPARPTRCR